MDAKLKWSVFRLLWKCAWHGVMCALGLIWTSALVILGVYDREAVEDIERTCSHLK